MKGEVSLVKLDAQKEVVENLFQLIGKTPMVKLRRIPQKFGVNTDMCVKLEFFNPTGSLKDRIYYEMITRAIERGQLKPGMEILEASTGNAGISCSFIGCILGYKVTIVMPKGMSRERMKMIRAYGGKILFTEGGESDVDLSIATIKEIIKKNPGKYWWPDQFSNPDNVMAHFKTTGPKI